MTNSFIIVPVVAALALGACGGQSKEDKAQEQVCGARADIAKQVDTLTALTPSTATTSQIKSSLQAIRKDLKAIKDAQGDLNDQRKSQVQAANEAFASQVQDVASTLVTSTSISDAKTQLVAAAQQLGTTYKQTFATVDCSES